MAFSLQSAQEAIISQLESSVAVDVHEVAIPDPDTVKRNAKGQFVPYVAIQFGDLQDGRGESFAGVWSADYILPIYIQAVAPTAKISREIGNNVLKGMLGFGVTYGAGVRKRVGGALFPLASNDGAVQAFVSPLSFGIRLQLFDNV